MGVSTVSRRKDPKTGLTQHQENYCLAYVESGVGAVAYRKAYPASLKWRDPTVHAQVNKMHSNPKIVTRIQILRDAAAVIAVVDQSMVLKEASRIAFSSIKNIRTKSGNIKKLSEWDDDVCASIKSIKIRGMKEASRDDDLEEKDTIVLFTEEISFWDKNSALEKLFKHLGLYEKDNWQKGSTLEDRLASMSPDKLALINRALDEHIKTGSKPGVDKPVDSGRSDRVTH